MKLVKSLLLGSAAGLVAVAGASAADLGVKKPTAVEYVKTCPTYGAGFFVVPGTTSCLKIVGRVRVDYLFNNDASAVRSINQGAAAPALTLGRTKDKNTFRARAYLGFDHRTATEYGLLRTYVRLYAERNNGTNGGAAIPSHSTAVTGGVNVEYAFIQFGGLTVGRVTPVFEAGFNTHVFGTVATGLAGQSDIYYVNSIGYTANLGGGFTANIALDAAKERQVGVITQAGPGGAIAAPAAAAIGSFNAGQAMPDLVAALAYTAAWGEVKLSGAVHQTRSQLVAAGKDTKYGYAGQLGAKFNLPFLAKGSNIWLVGSVASGASSYTGFNANLITQIGQVSFLATDAVLNTVNGKLQLTKTWGLAGGIQAFVTPTVWVALSGSYVNHDQWGVRNTVKGATVTGTVGWQPVAGFLIGGEVQYRQLQFPATAGNVSALVAGANPAAKSDITGRIRFQRDF